MSRYLRMHSPSGGSTSALWKRTANSSPFCHATGTHSRGRSWPFQPPAVLGFSSVMSGTKCPFQ